MYEAYYGFRDNPFRLTPDPDYLYLSPNHQEALGHLLFGVQEGSGVVVISGEIGTGKTTLLRTLVRNLDPHTIVAYIFNPALSALELLQTINAELGLSAASTSKKDLTDELNRFLLAQRTAGRRAIVIVDEAQDLEPPVLEQLRLLSNLETEREKLLQIILVGQPELRTMLAQPELAQLEQRIMVRWHLGSLSAGETAAYVRHRLQVAAEAREPVRFTPRALHLVYRFSRGVPRVINILCHRALLIGYTREVCHIDGTIVRQAIRELRSPTKTAPGGLRWGAFAAGSLASVGVAACAWVLSSSAPIQAWIPEFALRQLTHGTAQAPFFSSRATDLSVSAHAPLAHPDSPSVRSPSAAVPSSPSTSVAPGPASTLTSAPMAEEAKRTGEPFLSTLRDSDVMGSAARATNGLLRTWGVEELRTTERKNGTLDLGRIARARQLEYLPLGGSLSLLALLDLPVILELVEPQRQEMRFVLLVGISGDRYRVLLDQEYEVPGQLLRNNWFGKGHLFWKDFDDVGPLLTVGSVGQQVKRLHTLLAKARVFNGEMTGIGEQSIFTQHTKQAVARFQKAQRLTPDGVVGPLTMILLYHSLPDYLLPHLGTKPGASTGETQPVGAPAAMAVQVTERGTSPGQEGI